MVQIQFLARELPHTMGTANKREKTFFKEMVVYSKNGKPHATTGMKLRKSMINAPQKRHKKDKFCMIPLT